jgi:hypothetical protein
MRNWRITSLLLAAIFLGGGLAGGLCLGRGQKSNEAVSATTPAANGEKARDSTLDRQVGPIAPRPIFAASRRNVAAPPAQISADATVVVAEIAELQMMAEGADLDLSSEQWSTLAAVTLNIQAVRHAYEAQIAASTMLAPGRYRVEIPNYATAGDALRAKFQAELQGGLGETLATEIVAKLGSRLEAHFAGFGVSVQTLDIIADSRAGATDYQVTRTVRYWNSVEGADRLTTRRETHFPLWEDPTGESWGPLLAVVGA